MIDPEIPRITSLIKFGTVRLGHSTGEWVQDPDGWWREIYTDTIWFDQAGREERRAPFIACVRLSQPPESWRPPSSRSRRDTLRGVFAGMALASLAGIVAMLAAAWWGAA